MSKYELEALLYKFFVKLVALSEQNFYSKKIKVSYLYEKIIRPFIWDKQKEILDYNNSSLKFFSDKMKSVYDSVQGVEFYKVDIITILNSNYFIQNGSDQLLELLQILEPIM